MMEKVCCVIGNRKFTEEKIKKGENFALNFFEYCIENNCKHFLIGTTTGADVLAAKVIVSLKDKFPDVVLELVVKNEAMICHAPNEIKTLLLDNKIDLIHIEQKEHNDSDEREGYKCMIDRSDIVFAVCTGNVNSNIRKKLNYLKMKNKEPVIVIV